MSFLQGRNLPTKEELARYNTTLESIDDFLKETEAVDEMNLSDDDGCDSNNEDDD